MIETMGFERRKEVVLDGTPLGDILEDRIVRDGKLHSFLPFCQERPD